MRGSNETIPDSEETGLLTSNEVQLVEAQPQPQPLSSDETQPDEAQPQPLNSNGTQPYEAQPQPWSSNEVSNEVQLVGSQSQQWSSHEMQLNEAQPVLLEKRAVAGSFLFKFGDPMPLKHTPRPQVALFRRSDKVRTYQGKLAPISGSVEPQDKYPLHTALREIQEETGLKYPQDLDLLIAGKPYTFIDDAVGRQWTIHPFSWRLKLPREGGRGEEAIKLDWEHSGYEWHDPLHVADSEEFGGVPRLVYSLRRVWPEYDLGVKAGDILMDGLEDLKDDHFSGARMLAGRSVGILGAVMELKHRGVILDDIWWRDIRMTAWHLWRNGRESMGAAILSSLTTVLKDVWEVLKNEPNPTPEDMKQVVDEYYLEREKAKQFTESCFVRYIKENILHRNPAKTHLSILTLSASSTIPDCLLLAAERLDIALDVRILESRPLYEGVTLAATLLSSKRSAGINVTLYSDASAALAARGVDMFIFGADRISDAGDVSNKMGTLPAILSVRHIAPAAKIVVVSQIEKIAGPGDPDDHVIEDNGMEELVASWRHKSVKGFDVVKSEFERWEGNPFSTRLKVSNVYFEWVAAGLVDAYVTDRGIWSAVDIKERSERIADECKALFDDL